MPLFGGMIEEDTPTALGGTDRTTSGISNSSIQRKLCAGVSES